MIGTNPVGATVDYQWQITDNIYGIYTDIPGATSNTYTPVAADLGKYLQVKITAKGNYSGRVTLIFQTKIAP